MSNIEKIHTLFMGTSKFTDQAIALIDALSLTTDEFLTVTNLHNIQSFARFEVVTERLTISQRKWLCEKILEYDCAMSLVTEAEFTYKNIELAILFPNLERIKVVRVGKLIQDQSKLSFASFTHLEKIELESCYGDFELPSGLKELRLRYSQLIELNLDKHPDLEHLELMVTTVKQIHSTKPTKIRRLNIVKSPVDVHQIFSDSQCPQLESISLRLLQTTNSQFAFAHPNLHHLSVQESNIQCVFPRPLPLLESLNLIDCVSCTTLELPELPSLQRLVVQGIPIPVLNLPDLPNLHHLDLSLTDIQSIDLSRTPNILHLELQHSKIETLDCTAATSLVFLSVHETPLHTLTGLSSTVQALMVHQTELAKKPLLSSLQYLTYAEDTENSWSDLTNMIDYLEKEWWIRAGEHYEDDMLQPLKHHFGSCLDKGRIRRLQCLLQARHDFLDCAYTSDGKTVVATDPGWDEERLTPSGLDAEDTKVSSLQVQCLYELLFKSSPVDLGDYELAKVLNFEPIGNGDGDDNAEVYYIDPQIPLEQLQPHELGRLPSGLYAYEYRDEAENYDCLRTWNSSLNFQEVQINGMMPSYGGNVSCDIFQILLWLEYRSVQQPLLSMLSSSMHFDALMMDIARGSYPSILDWQWNPDNGNELIPM